jgi:hypothetical protein
MQNEIEIKPLANAQLEAQALERLQETVRRDPSAENFHVLQNRLSAENGLGETYAKAVEDAVSKYDTDHNVKNLTKFGNEYPKLSRNMYISATPEAIALVDDNEKMQIASLAIKNLEFVSGHKSTLNENVLDSCIQEVHHNGYKGLKGMPALQMFCADLTKSFGNKVSIEDLGVKTESEHYGLRHLVLQMDHKNGSHSIPVYVKD